MDRNRLMRTLMVVLLVQVTRKTVCANPSIALDSHFAYIVVGGDHVAESVGRYLSARDPNKTVLVLKGSQCNDVLEPSEPSRLWLEASYLFAESAHYLGYEFIDPFTRPSKPGIAFTNQTMDFMPVEQQLYAVDPNLKLLTDARPQRIIYNKASSTVLGVEVSINFEPHYVFAREELIIAGRCVEDYRLLAKADILPRSDLLELLHNVPLELALKSPIISPIFKLESIQSSDRGQPSFPAQPYYLLATELYVKSGTMGAENQGQETAVPTDDIQPNAKVNLVIKEQPPSRWIGFCPSVILREPSPIELPDRGTILATLVSTIELSIKLGSSETFQKLGLALQQQQAPVPPSATFCPNGTNGQQDSVACFVNRTLSTVYSGQNESLEPPNPVLQTTKHLTEDFRLRTSRNLRILPLGLTAPFLEHWWKRIFTPRPLVREYTTRTGVLSPPEQLLPNSIPLGTLLEKLKERLKVIDSTGAKRV